MLKPVIKSMPTKLARHIQAGGTDANGQLPEHKVSNGQGNPCRHCLQMIPKGEPFLVFSHRPFEADQPYAERGPIFLCAKKCEPFRDDGTEPAAFSNKEVIMIRGYDKAERIVYGTGKIVPVSKLRDEAADILNLEEVEFIHVRSSVNNCFQARIESE
jgi:hypothetical protein